MSSRANDKVDAVIRSAGLKVTRQRRAIFRVLSRAGDHPDANEIHRRAQTLDPSVSVATTYRTLAALSDKGVVKRLSFEGASSRFETNDAPHHDHIVDLDSGEVIEFVSTEIEQLQHKIAEAHGFEIVSHRFELYCRKRRSR